jgi:hypothetical protein
VLSAIGFTEAHNIQPMAAPALAVMTRSEQMFHILFVSHARLITRRGQANEIKTQPARERPIVGSRGEIQTLFTQLL